jgi:hypothetical protein
MAATSRLAQAVTAERPSYASLEYPCVQSLRSVNVLASHPEGSDASVRLTVAQAQHTTQGQLHACPRRSPNPALTVTAAKGKDHAMNVSAPDTSVSFRSEAKKRVCWSKSRTEDELTKTTANPSTERCPFNTPLAAAGRWSRELGRRVT